MKSTRAIRTTLRTGLAVAAMGVTAVLVAHGGSNDSTAWASASPAAPAPSPLAPRVAPVGEVTVPGRTEVNSTLNVSFVCPAGSASNGQVKSSVSADNVTSNVDNTFNVLASFDVAAQGQATYATVADGIKVTWAWNLPASVKPATGLLVRVACDGTIDPADATTFKKALTAVVNPPNKFVRADFPAEIAQGSNITFKVTCDREAVGGFAILDKTGKPVLQSMDTLGDGGKGLVSTTRNASGYDLVVAIPVDLAVGDYSVQLSCSSVVTDVVPLFPAEFDSDATTSPPLQLKVIAKKLPPTA